MKKMVFISLLQTCMIAGLPRSPVEGVQQVPADEAKRLVASKMAEYADIADSDDKDDGDGLDGQKVEALRSLAKDEGIEVAGNANKAALIDAIRGYRDRQSLAAELTPLDRAALADRAKAEGVDVTDDDDAVAIRTAIFTKRFPPNE